jgi:chaperonin GroEL
MEVAKMINEAGVKAIDYVDSIKRPAVDADYVNIAHVSCGDKAIAELLSEMIKKVGVDNNILVEEHLGLGVYAEVVDGFYIKNGFTDVRLIKDPASKSSDFENPKIFITEKTISEGKEIDRILTQCITADIKELVIVGEVIQNAKEVLVKRFREGFIIPTLVNLRTVAGLRQLALGDLATMTGGRVYGENDIFSVDFLGESERAIIEELSSTIIRGKGDKKEIERRVNILSDQLKTESHATTTSALRARILCLKGKMGIVKVGAPTDMDRMELRLRIDDAVCALQAAKREGVVPGGGTTLARVLGTAFDEIFQKLFIELVTHANDKPEYLLGKILEKPLGFGYDLKNMTVEPIDLYEAGVIDPALVIKEVVRNACSISSTLITTSVLIVYSDDSNNSMMDLIKKQG